MQLTRKRSLWAALFVSIAVLILAPLYAQAGVKKMAAMAAFSYAAKKMVQPGVSTELRKKAASKFWGTLEKHPDLAAKAVSHLRDAATKNPQLRKQFLDLAERVSKRFPEIRSVHADPRVTRINGRLPLNSEYAGRVFPASKLPVEIRSKYPNGVPFTNKGFPDFSRYSVTKVQIKPQPTRAGDFKLANQAAGYRTTPKGYTWHHTEKSGEMILIPSDIHRAVAHTGGIAVGK